MTTPHYTFTARPTDEETAALAAEGEGPTCPDEWFRLHGEDMYADFWYPRSDGNPKRLHVGMLCVRAADNIVIEYDFDRDGWKITQAISYLHPDGSRDADAPQDDHEEVAFIPAWLERPTPNPMSDQKAASFDGRMAAHFAPSPLPLELMRQLLTAPAAEAGYSAGDCVSHADMVDQMLAFTECAHGLAEVISRWDRGTRPQARVEQVREVAARWNEWVCARSWGTAPGGDPLPRV